MDTLFSISFRGTLVQIDKDTLQCLPKKSKFCTIIKKHYSLELHEILRENRTDITFFINRSSSLFNYILDYIENGELHFPQYICPTVILKELEFWGYSVQDLGLCCLDRILKQKEDDENFKQIATEWLHINDTRISLFDNCCSSKNTESNVNNTSQPEIHCEENSSLGPVVMLAECKAGDKGERDDNLHMQPRSESTPTRKNICCRCISTVFVDPLTSTSGKIWMAIIMVTIALSMVTLMLGCDPRIRHPSFEEFSKTANITLGEGLYNLYFYNSVPDLWVGHVDFVCGLILTVDYIGRCLVSHNRLHFLAHPFNIIDILGIIPVWISFTLIILAGIQEWSLEDWKFFDRHRFIAIILEILHILRIFRFRLILMNFRHLRMITLAFKRSVKELCILSTLLTMASVVYGALMFFVEVCSETTDSFPSGFHAQWWAIVTMTTVGYGDFVPKTDIGYLIAASCAVFGIVIVAMTTSIIITNFMYVYKNVETIQRKEKHLKSVADTNDETKCSTNTSSHTYL